LPQTPFLIFVGVPEGVRFISSFAVRRSTSSINELYAIGFGRVEVEIKRFKEVY
jgi:hypothetical protein